MEQYSRKITDSGRISKNAITTHDKQIVELLKKHIEQMIGQPVKTPKDFTLLAEKIFGRIHVQLSPTTLKRLWGYLNEPVAPRPSTLNYLAQFLGYSNLASFCESVQCPLDPQSHLVIGRMIAAEQIPLRAHIRLTWAPERVCEIVHEGNGRFSVLHSQKTKLQAGDTFECKLFIEQEPLYLYNLTHLGQAIPAYVAGKKDGIYFEYI